MVFSASSLVVYVSLFHLFILHSVDSQCPRQFNCGNLSNLEFPLSTSSGCGLLKVECSAGSNPKIHLDNDSFSPSYEILEKLSTNQLFIRNHFLHSVLYGDNYEERCNLFSDHPMPHSPSISISFFPNITLFKCAKDRNYDNEISNFQENYKNYTGCEDFKFNIYYPKSNASLPPPNDDCSVLHLPIKFQDNSESLDLFERLSADYNLEWNVTGDCLNCHRKGGNCTTDTENESRCHKGIIGL